MQNGIEFVTRSEYRIYLHKTPKRAMFTYKHFVSMLKIIQAANPVTFCHNVEVGVATRQTFTAFGYSYRGEMALKMEHSKQAGFTTLWSRVVDSLLQIRLVGESRRRRLSGPANEEGQAGIDPSGPTPIGMESKIMFVIPFWCLLGVSGFVFGLELLVGLQEN